jgi:hypothetical protein
VEVVDIYHYSTTSSVGWRGGKRVVEGLDFDQVVIPLNKRKTQLNKRKTQKSFYVSQILCPLCLFVCVCREVPSDDGLNPPIYPLDRVVFPRLRHVMPPLLALCFHAGQEVKPMTHRKKCHLYLQPVVGFQFSFGCIVKL